MEFRDFVLLVVLAAVLIMGLAVDSMVGKYTLNECRVAALYTGMAADDIAKVCK